MVKIDRDNEDLVISFPYSAETVEKIRALTNRWDKATHTWRINASRAAEIERIFPSAIIPDGHSSLQGGVLSGWGSLLRPHQREAFQRLARQTRCALFDPCGSGKSRVALGWAVARGRFPVLIVCPRVAKIHWSREIEACIPGEPSVILSGRSAEAVPYGTRWAIINFDLLDSRMDDLLAFGFGALILDEAHLAKAGKKTLRGHAAMHLADKIPNVIALTASPMPNGRPSELLAMLMMLRKVHEAEAWKWKLRFCDAKQIVVNPKGVKIYHRKPVHRWDFRGASNLGDLHRQLATFSVQRRKEQILDSLPAIQHSVFEVDDADLTEYKELQQQMAEHVRAGDKGKALGTLTKMLVATAKAKVEAALDVCKERLNSGLRTIAFSDFIEPLSLMRRALPHQSTTLEGAMPEAARQTVIDRFQSDPSPHVLLCSRRAIGLSVTLTAADCALFLSMPWTPTDWEQAWGRIHRMGQTRGTQTINLLCVGTYDEEQIHVLYSKAGITELAAGRPPLPIPRKLDFEKILQLIGGQTCPSPESFGRTPVGVQGR